MNKPRGFSVVELMVTLAILAILLVVAVPSFTGLMDQRRLKNQTEAIRDYFRIAKSEATRQSSHSTASTGYKLVSATVNPTAPWLIGLSNSTTACTDAASCQINQANGAQTYLLRADECSACTLTTGSGATVVMSFSMRGVLRNGANTITVTSPLGRSLRIDVNAIGRTSICAPSGNVSGYATCS